MEVAAADIMWRRTISQGNFRYTTILCDGDSKTFIHLEKQNIYNGIPLVREQCVNHVKKRMTTALHEEIKKAKAQKITLGGNKKGALTDKCIKHLSNYYLSCIKRNKNNVEKMRTEVLATLAHCSSTDEKHDHSLCPKGEKSWCFFNKATALGLRPPTHNNMPVFLNSTVNERLKPIFERLSKTELLAGCSQGLTQNANEGLHSVVWRLCPKTIFVSKDKIEIAAAKGVAHFNLGALKTAELYKKQALTDNAIKIFNSQDLKRQRQSDIKSSIEEKKDALITSMRKKM
ncbi:uncharacterized protein LOC131667523 [Phymastichus coffea]|uniref:uncharacterized protein LOC131667523 n=1 Tax=Phymastichus coffea TaxID=108790 RepID=UPI00273CB63C|nr:uncharacterized protein LOC131667523 [Phymastichus coffea]